MTAGTTIAVYDTEAKECLLVLSYPSEDRETALREWEGLHRLFARQKKHIGLAYFIGESLETILDQHPEYRRPRHEKLTDLLTAEVKKLLIWESIHF